MRRTVVRRIGVAATATAEPSRSRATEALFAPLDRPLVRWRRSLARCAVG